MSETVLTGAACRWCGSDDDECLYTQCHDLPDGEEHAPCGAYFPSEDNVSDAGIGRAALTLAQARIRELETALEPFANDWRAFPGCDPDGEPTKVTVADFKRARQAIKEAGE